MKVKGGPLLRFVCGAAGLAILFGIGRFLAGYGRGCLNGRTRAQGSYQPSLKWVGTAALGEAGSPSSVRTSQSRRATVTATPGRIIQKIDTRPLAFEPNRGQSDGAVKFLSHGSGYALFLTNDEAVLEMREPDTQIRKPSEEEANHETKLETRHWRATRKKGKRPVDAILRMKFVHADSHALVVGVGPLASKTNYFIGNNPAQWHADVPNFTRVKYENIYPGVELVFYGNQRQLEYDFVLAPGADPGLIQLAVDLVERAVGTQEAGFADRVSQRQVATPESKLRGRQSARRATIRIDGNGDLLVLSRSGEVRFHKPSVYQEILPDGHTKSTDAGAESVRSNRSPESALENQQFLEGHYVLTADGTVGFEIPNYDRSRGLIIDPALSYSTFLGGAGNDWGAGIAVDAAGNAYITGTTLSTNFPTASPFQASCGGCALNKTTAFVAKFDSAGANLVYSTYLGGSNEDSSAAVAVDSAGEAYVVGATLSSDFPTTPGAFQTACSSCGVGQPDAFVTKLNAAGSALVFSSYLGGSNQDVAAGVAVDASGSAYITGTTNSDDFPTVSPLQNFCNGCSNGNSDAFVAKFNPDGTSLMYSTFVGGTGLDEGHSIAVDSSGNAYVTGLTGSNDLQTVNAFQPFSGGNQDAFVIKLDPAGQGPVYFSYLGGSGNDQGNSIAVDADGNVYVTGSTSSPDFPTAGTLAGELRGSQSAFVTKVNQSGSALDFSIYIGGSGTDSGTGIAVDSAGNAYLTGSTNSTDFPLVSALPSTSPGVNQGVNGDAFVTKVNSVGSAIVFSSYLGGSDVDAGTSIAVDSPGNAYITGNTFSGNFPTTANAFQTVIGGQFDAFVTKLNSLALPAAVLSPSTLTFGDQFVNVPSAAQTIALTNGGDAALDISSISAATTPASPAQFSETDTCVGSVAASSSCTISVVFTPAAAGPQNGLLTITDNESNSPQSVSLYGVGVPAFSISVAPKSQTVNRGTDSTAFTASAASSYGFTGAVTLSCQDNQPANCAFNPATIIPGQSSTLTVSNLTPISADTLNFMVVGTSGTPVTQTAQQPLQILFPDYNLLVAPTTADVNAGQTATYTLSVSPINGFNQSVNFTCTNPPATLSCTITPSSVTLDGTNTSTPTITIATTARSGTGFSEWPLFHGPPVSQHAGLCLLFLCMGLFMLMAVAVPRRHAGLRFAVTGLFVLLGAACSVGGNPQKGTPAGTYQIQIQGAVNNSPLTHTISVEITVN
jgi:hypothetical protein